MAAAIVAETDTSEHLYAIERLLAEAATTANDDPSWDVLRRRARNLTQRLAEAGLVPADLVTALADAPVVVSRGLLVAARTIAVRTAGASPAALASATPSDRRRGTWESTGTVAS